jgi:hypothetical protein
MRFLLANERLINVLKAILRSFVLCRSLALIIPGRQQWAGDSRLVKSRSFVCQLGIKIYFQMIYRNNAVKAEIYHQYIYWEFLRI